MTGIGKLGCALAAVGLLAGCGGGATQERGAGTGTTAGGAPGGAKPSFEPTIRNTEGWPEELIAGPGRGPALYLNERPNAPEVGYVSPGVRVELAGERVDDRTRVYIAGAMKIRAWIAIDRLSLRVHKRGRIPDTPVYLGPNDVVGVRGPSDREGILKVEAMPYLGRGGPEARLGPFSGIYPADRLGLDEVDPSEAEGPSPGEPRRLPEGREVPVYDKPGGEVVATLPAMQPPLRVVVLRERQRWKGIRAGAGPYLVGYVDVPLEPAQSPPSGDGLGTGPVSDGPVPARLQEESDRPLWRLKKGSRVYFYDEESERHVFAILKEPGFAREMNRYEEQGEVDVFAACDDSLAVRGLVLERALEPYEPGGEASEEEAAGGGEGSEASGGETASAGEAAGDAE